MQPFPLHDDPLGQPGEAYAFQHLVWAYTVTGVLLAATELDLFTGLAAGPATAAELASRCGTLPRWTEKLLTACCAMGLVERDGAHYRNSSLAARYLVRGAPSYQGHIILHQRRWERWQELAHRVRTGAAGPSEALGRAGRSAADRTAAHRTWIYAMHDIAMAGQAEALAGAVSLAGRRRLCDVGGGPGTYALALCRRFPDLRAVVMDLPETEPIAREVIQSLGLADRVEFRAGDYLRDEYGRDNDVVLLSGVLHGESEPDCRLMLRKAHAALVPGGLALVQEIVLHEDGTGPLLPALFNLHMSNGAAYSGSQIAGWLQEAGFAGVEVLPLTGYSWLNALVMGRRP